MLTPTRLLWALGLTGLLMGCGSTFIVGTPPEDGGTTVDVQSGNDAAAIIDRGAPPVIDAGAPLRRCTSRAQCGPQEDCVGTQGCDVPWTCQSTMSRACTTDAATFCGCDGIVFQASSTCPGRPYQNRGTCDSPPPPRDSGTTPVPACVLPDGTVCAFGETCVARDRCTFCRCTARGVECTGVACGDGGVVPPSQPCRTSSDCDDTDLCVGPEGCGVRWTCQPRPPCTRDSVTWCGCDGQPFMASSTCPGRPVASRGPCATPVPDGGITPPPIDAGPATCTIGGVTCRVNERCIIDRCSVCVCDGRGSTTCQVITACNLDAGTVGVDASTRPDAGARGCRAQEARGEGFCDLLQGIYWQGNRCVAVGGCSCVGADCAGRYASFEACEMAHVICPR